MKEDDGKPRTDAGTPDAIAHRYTGNERRDCRDWQSNRSLQLLRIVAIPSDGIADGDIVSDW